MAKKLSGRVGQPGHKVKNIMRWLRKGRIRFFRGQRGIGLLETLIAAAILGLIGTSVLTALNTNAEATGTLDEHVVATNLATAYIEAIKAWEYLEDYPQDQPPLNSITVPSQYLVNVDITFTSDSTPNGGIDWYPKEDVRYDNDTIQKLTVTVSREGGKPVLTICAFKTKRQEG